MFLDHPVSVVKYQWCTVLYTEQ